MTPAVHATLVGLAALLALISAGVCLARHARALSVRLHALYAMTAAWWLFSMAMVAGAESPGRAQRWARLAQAGIGLLPGVVYHVNVVVTGLQREYQHPIRVHYGLAAAVTIFALTFPGLLADVQTYEWGFYPAYTAWGLVPAGALLVVFAEVLHLYRAAVRRYPAGTVEHARARAFQYGNFVAFLAAVDLLPAFGVPVYPFGFVTVGLMFAATMYGLHRYCLNEITPGVAAEHILDTMPDALLVVDTRNRVRIANAAAARLLGRPTADLIERPVDHTISDPDLLGALAPPASGGSIPEVQFTAADGRRPIVSATHVPVHLPSGRPLAHVWLLRDLTDQRSAEAERNQLESWVRETQKMESLGVLAGGIAHDFNNILMAIMGNAELAKGRAEAGERVTEELQTIVTSAEYASSLTDQLLTYAGRDTSIDATVDLGELCRDMADLLRSAMSKKAVLDLDLPAVPTLVRGDRSQLRQVILNLVTNASDAIGDRAGTTTVRIALQHAADAVAAAPAVGEAAHPARRVVLEVTDTGAGMDAETKARIFDPFFTTKFTGRGLGLAIVFRIVETLGGRISVTSTPGQGSQFQVVLPELVGVAPTSPSVPAPTPVRLGTGVALLADDEAAVRGVVRSMLTALGFRVVAAANGREAVDLFRARPEHFAVVVLDITMPGMNGREAAAEIRRLAPAMPVVFVSGYTAAATDIAGALDARTVFVHKPFTLPTLAAGIRSVLDGRQAPHAPGA